MGLLLIVFSGQAQTWQKKNVGNNVYVSFPAEVKYEMKSSNGKNVAQYASKTDNCLFMVMVLYDVIPNYSNFVNMKQSDQNEIISIYLDNYCKGKLMYNNSQAVTKKSIVNIYQARQLSYSAINPVSGETGKRFSKSIVVANKLFSFECWYLNENPNSQNEKADFFNSIEIK